MNELKEDILLNYLQGECSAGELAEVNRWLDESPDNRETLFALELAFNLPKKERYAKLSNINRAENKLLKRVDAHERMVADMKRRRRSVKLAWRYAAVAAVALLVAAAVYFKPALSENNVVVSVAANDPVRQIILPDGTKVWLNQSSTLKYPESYSASNRQIYLDGEAFFDVVKSPGSPFVARSRAVQVTVLGTTFNMRSFDGEPVTEATLITGEIEIKGNHNEGQIVLQPGQKAEVNTDTKRMKVKTVNAPLDAVWRDNLIPFNEASLFEIAKTLEHFYGVKIVFDRNVNISNNYSGFIRRKDSIDEVFKLLTNSIPISYRIKGDTIYVGTADR